MTKVGDGDYIPSYTRTAVTDALHEISGFRTDYEITRNKVMKGIIRMTKNDRLRLFLPGRECYVSLNIKWRGLAKRAKGVITIFIKK